MIRRGKDPSKDNVEVFEIQYKVHKIMTRSDKHNVLVEYRLLAIARSRSYYQSGHPPHHGYVQQKRSFEVYQRNHDIVDREMTLPHIQGKA